MRTQKKICLVSCYKDPEYVRIKTLEAALRGGKRNTIIVRNRRKNFLRYIEVAVKLFTTRLKDNPDLYIITFRGYEILPVVLLFGVGKKIIFDEFINPIEWAVYEHKKLAPDGLTAKVIKKLYLYMLKRVDVILADTKSHAEYSAGLMGLDISKYAVVPVGADEAIFDNKKNYNGVQTERFTVLYYGSMLPLHGIEYVIDAAEKLKDQEIDFLLIGGGKVDEKIHEAIDRGAKITYKKWVPYRQLAEVILNSTLCLGGPFGNTVQSRFVVTGKTLQFLRMKKPVILGKNEETYIFKDKKNALIVDQASSESLQGAILWAHNNPKELMKLSSQGYRLYVTNYSKEVIDNKLNSVIDTTLT